MKNKFRYYVGIVHRQYNYCVLYDLNWLLQYNITHTHILSLSRGFSQIKTHWMTTILHLRNKRFVGTAQNWSTRRDTIVAPVIDWGEFLYIRSPKPTKSDWGGIAYNIVQCFTIYYTQYNNMFICVQLFFIYTTIIIALNDERV